MTKSEAKAVNESMTRALRVLEGVEMPWSKMPPEVIREVRAKLEKVTEECQRVSDMARAELGK